MGILYCVHSSGALGLVDRVGVCRSRGKSGVRLLPAAYVRTTFPIQRPRYPHRVCSELENSGIRMTVGDCSVTEHRQWCPLYQTVKTVHVHAKPLKIIKKTKHGAECAWSLYRITEPLEKRCSENWIKTITLCLFLNSLSLALPWTI